MVRYIIPALISLVALVGAAHAQTMDRVSASKEVRVGFIADQPPFSAKGEGGTPAGYAIDICGVIVKAISRRVEGVKTTYVETPFNDAFGSVAAGQIDLLCGAVSATLERRQTVDFSEPFFITGMTALFGSYARRDLREFFLGKDEISPPRSPELRPYETLQIGVRLGTTTEATLREAVTKGGYRAQILGFTTHAAGLAALESRQIDAYFADRGLLLGLLAQARNPSNLVIGTRLFSREFYAVAIQRGDSDFRLLVDRALAQLYTGPELIPLLQKYFGTEAAALRAQVLALSLPE